jgi:hypothetical protein
MALSFFHTDKLVYNYPKTKMDLSNALANNFSQGFFFGKFNIYNLLESNETFSIQHKGKIFGELNGKVLDYKDDVKIEIEIKASGLIIFGIICMITIFLELSSFGSIWLMLSFLTLFKMYEYYLKIDIKQTFEKKLGLEPNNEIIERKLTIF